MRGHITRPELLYCCQRGGRPYSVSPICAAYKSFLCHLHHHIFADYGSHRKTVADALREHRDIRLEIKNQMRPAEGVRGGPLVYSKTPSGNLSGDNWKVAGK